MDKYAGTVFTMKKIMSDLENSISVFNSFWMPLARNAIVYPIPVPVKDSGLNCPWVPSLDHIDFPKITGQEGINLAASAIARFHRFPQDAALNIRRWPGVVLLPSSARNEMLDHLESINQLKENMQLCLSLFSTQEKKELISKTFTSVHILMVYRLVYFAVKDVYSVSYSWMGKQSKNATFDREKFVSLFHSEIEKFKDDSNMLNIMTNNLELLSLYSDEQLVVRNQFAPSPRQSFLYVQEERGNKKASWDKLINASLPLFIAQDDDPIHHELNPWSIDQTNQGARSKNYTSLIPEYNIFVRS